MEIPTYLLFVLGCLGATDVTLFHSVAHGIRSHPDSAGELITHSLRGPTYAILFLVIPNFALHGLFAWGLVFLLLFDVGISIWDFSLEQGSRRFLGGLPGGEYVLHMLMAIVFGAFAASLFCFAYPWFTAPTRVVYAPARVPALLRLTLLVMAIAVLVSGIQDAAAVVHLRRRGFRGSPAPWRNPADKSFHATEVKPPQTPAWTRLVLRSAGLYNLVWGAWVILFPEALFRWAGMPPINYPQIWHCVGMLVGVYGIGYWIAANNPFQHWPLVLVGLLGKILGPVGMWWSVAHGGLPHKIAWICLTNDLIWWVPFALILRRVFLVRHSAASGSDCGGR